MKIVIYFTLCLLILGCSKRTDDSSEAVTSVHTGLISGISPSSITLGGAVLKDAGYLITERGICWGTCPYPTIDQNTIAEGEGLGEFEVTINGLSIDSTYYARAYAINSLGVKYGKDLIFNVGYYASGQGITDAGGITYETVIIGNQEWMAENLRSSRFCNGEPILYIDNLTEWVNDYDNSAYTYLNNDENFEVIYGKQYNIRASRDERNICPCGWHIPKYSEWAELISFLHPAVEIGESGTQFYTNAGHLLKSESGWVPNGQGNNASGFNAFPGGVYGQSMTELTIAQFWSSDVYTYMDWLTRNMRLTAYNEQVGFALTGFTQGNYVRCLKDN
jgi:uncharacterized protein (TIGR02145 family)